MSEDMFPAITIWQPWASLIVAGIKNVEWRTWPAPQRFVGRRIAIHAGAKRLSKSELAGVRYEITARIGSWSLVDAATIARAERIIDRAPLLPLRAIVGTAILGQPAKATALLRDRLTVREMEQVDPDKWGWPLSDTEPMEPPVPATGAQGWWWWPTLAGTVYHDA